MQNSDHANAALFAGVGLKAVLCILAVVLVIYIFFCYCAKRICEKCGDEPGVLIWIPIAKLAQTRLQYVFCSLRYTHRVRQARSAENPN